VYVRANVFSINCTFWLMYFRSSACSGNSFWKVHVRSNVLANVYSEYGCRQRGAGGRSPPGIFYIVFFSLFLLFFGLFSVASPPGNFSANGLDSGRCFSVKCNFWKEFFEQVYGIRCPYFAVLTFFASSYL